MNLSPIALFVYNRLFHTQQTVEALAKNELAIDSDLLIFSDGPKSEADRSNVSSLREYLKTITGFKTVTVVERDVNLGCARSITSGVSEVVNRFGRIIVVEDDIVTAPFFLKFMNEALEFYQDEDKVICIHGYLYPITVRLPETFFLRGADIWGWGTWKRGWDLYEYDARKLFEELRAKNLTSELDSYGYIRLLKKQIAGNIDTWDVQWYVSAFLKGKLTLYPGKSLVKNIGYDSSGTHCNTTDDFIVELCDAPLTISRIEVIEDNIAKKAIGDFLKLTRPGKLMKLIRKYKSLVGRLFPRD